MFHPIGSKATARSFAYMPGMILTGHEPGKVALFNADTGEEMLFNERAHMDSVTDLQLSADRSYFITSSKDKTARTRYQDALYSRRSRPRGRGSVYFTRSFDEMCLLPPTAHS